MKPYLKLYILCSEGDKFYLPRRHSVCKCFSMLHSSHPPSHSLLVLQPHSPVLWISGPILKVRFFKWSKLSQPGKPQRLPRASAPVLSLETVIKLLQRLCSIGFQFRSLALAHVFILAFPVRLSLFHFVSFGSYCQANV